MTLSPICFLCAPLTDVNYTYLWFSCSISKPTFPENGSDWAKVEAITLFSTIRFRVAGLSLTVGGLGFPLRELAHAASSFTSFRREVHRCCANSPSWNRR